ncbi:radiation-inducible immediate-early gene IEX-1 [Polyodon spathula]|uniref:radiation-inducible immediate-early gene IEX-1 n=1 Tax=Polyodon spathula TaxID=7913 RepID=UPI001B7DC222|nr:radiation-inducible immediate-early gene IEX-1 [Polyodon spathula]
MYARSNSVILSIPAPAALPESLSCRVMNGRKEPEIFTFEELPLQVRRSSLGKPRRRPARVMYPSKVRKYLPPGEKSPAKRLFLVLCVVLFLQIYTEDPTQETPTGTVETAPTGAPLSEDLSFSEYQLLSFFSAEVPEMKIHPSGQQEGPDGQAKQQQQAESAPKLQDHLSKP